MEKNNLKEIIEDFQQKLHLYEDLSIKTDILLQSIIKDKIAPHQIQSRIKNISSLNQKIIKKKHKYKTLEEITDILGFRIITYFEDDIDIIEKIILKEFQIDKNNSIDKRNIEIDKFGYRSVHYIVSVNKERLKLTEYKKFENLKFEIQVRSILQHSWAEIEHDIGYKGISEIPLTAKRTFYRVAALLEQADIEFTKLRQEIKDFENTISLDLQNKKSEIELDKSALIAFIKNSSVITKIEKRIEKELDCRCIDVINNNMFVDSRIIDDLKDLKINNIIDLEMSLIINADEIIKNQKSFIQILRKHKVMDSINVAKGAPITWLIDYLKKL